MLGAVLPFLEFAAPTGPLVWTVALSTAVAKLLGTVLAKRLRWFLYCLWCGGPEPPTGGLAPGELATDLAEELLETRAAAERQASSSIVANPPR